MEEVCVMIVYIVNSMPHALYGFHGSQDSGILFRRTPLNYTKKIATVFIREKFRLGRCPD